MGAISTLTNKEYNTILDIPVRSGWYLSTWFLHVDKSRTYLSSSYTLFYQSSIYEISV